MNPNVKIFEMFLSHYKDVKCPKHQVTEEYFNRDKDVNAIINKNYPEIRRVASKKNSIFTERDDFNNGLDESGSVRYIVQELHQISAIAEMVENLLTHTDLKNIKKHIIDICVWKKNNDMATHGSRFIDFKQFCVLRERLNTKQRSFVPINLFSQLYIIKEKYLEYENSDTDDDEEEEIKIVNPEFNCIDSNLLYKTIKHANFCKQCYVSLSIFDYGNRNSLNESELMDYVERMVIQSPVLSKLVDRNFKQVYVCNITQYVLFLLDRRNTKNVRIDDFATSELMVKFSNMCRYGKSRTLKVRRNRHSTTSTSHNTNSINEINSEDWFEVNSAVSVFEMYVSLDSDGDGLLTKDDFFTIPSVTLGRGFVEQLIAKTEHLEEKVDYKSFVNFLIAYTNIGCVNAINYFFPFLDMNNDNYIDKYEIYYFYKENFYNHEMTDKNMSDFENFYIEIIDMAQPENIERGISIKDLIRCKNASTVLSMLIEMKHLDEVNIDKY